MPKLLINEGGQASVFELFDDEATMGRGASNAIQIVDAHASKHHAVIRRTGGRVKLVDLESKNGTRVNGEFRNQRWLQHGDAVSVGAAVLTYDASDTEEIAEVPATAAVASVGGGGTARAIAAPASAGTAPRSRRDRERDRDRDRDRDDEDERPRRSSRRQSNPATTVLLVGGGLLAVVALFFLLIHGKGNPPNTMALQYARNLSLRGGRENAQAALDYLVANGDPSDRDSYVNVGKEIEALKQKLLADDENNVEVEANKEMKKIEDAFIEKWKTHKTEESFGADLLKWAAKYKDTRALGAFEAGNRDPKLLIVYKKAKSGAFPPK